MVKYSNLTGKVEDFANVKSFTLAFRDRFPSKAASERYYKSNAAGIDAAVTAHLEAEKDRQFSLLGLNCSRTKFEGILKKEVMLIPCTENSMGGLSELVFEHVKAMHDYQTEYARSCKYSAQHTYTRVALTRTEAEHLVSGGSILDFCEFKINRRPHGIIVTRK